LRHRDERYTSPKTILVEYSSAKRLSNSSPKQYKNCTPSEIMPFGLDDDELLAHIDLQERRQQRLGRIKQAEAPTRSQETLPSMLSHVPLGKPPPSYGNIMQKPSTEVNPAASDKNYFVGSDGLTVDQKESPPPYSLSMAT
jgi:hypothetical protein